MQLTISDVAQLCEVSENQVYRWIQEDGLPAEQVADRFRVNPAELLEWTTARKLKVSPAIFQKMNGDSIGDAGLAEALKIGGVAHDVKGDDRESVLSRIVESLPLPDGFHRPSLVQLFLSREAMGGTAIGDGIAIPHPNKPVVLPGARRVMRLCFLAQPIEFGAADGKPVDTLFLLICPTVRDHLQLLARLATVLRDDSFRGMLREKPSAELIINEVQRLEGTFQESA